MESRFLLRALRLIIFILVTITIHISGHLQIPLEIEKPDEQLNSDIHSFFDIIDGSKDLLGCYSFISYTGSFDLKPSLEQRLMEHFSVPIYSVDSKSGPVKHRYPAAQYFVIVLFGGMDDPTLAALNDTELSDGSLFFTFLYIPPRNVSRVLSMEEIREFFSWCRRRGFIRAFLCFRGQSEFETWSYFHFTNVTVTRLTEKSSYENVLRSQGFRFLVQVANDPPIIYSYNSTEQADVMGDGSISLSGFVGILMVEFMRHINATMDILPFLRPQGSNYKIIESHTNRIVDMAANPVENGSLLFSPVVLDSQMCLMLPHRRKIPFDRYFDKARILDSEWYSVSIIILIFAIKYISHRRRSLVDSFFSTLRFTLAIPLPGGQLERLPLADKIIEVYCFLCVAILASMYASFYSSILTTDVYRKPITDAESLRDSGLRIMTRDISVQQAFKDNEMPRSLLDLVDLVDNKTVFSNVVALNDRYVYVIRSPNWRGFRYYQERLKEKRFVIGGPKLCSRARQLRLPISPKSPLRYIFQEYYQRVFESGLQEKWIRFGFDKFLKLRGIAQLPRETEKEWIPLNLSFYTRYLKMFIGGMILSTFLFILELIYERYRG